MNLSLASQKVHKIKKRPSLCYRIVLYKKTFAWIKTPPGVVEAALPGLTLILAGMAYQPDLPIDYSRYGE